VLKGKGLHALWVFSIGTLVAVSMSGAAVADASHSIRQGDTVYDIAKRYGVSVRSIQRANGLNDHTILALGRTLTIPGVADAHRRHASLRKHLRTHRSEDSSLIRARNAEDLRTRQEESPATTSGDAQAREPQGEDGRASRDLVRTAFIYRGSRYRFGGTSRGGFDCSGFTRYVYARYGIALPHSSASQFSHGQPISRDELQPGDLVFFATRTRGISHVGIYIGDNRFIHASNVRRGVTVDSLGSAYYSARYRGARRVK
jgi:cell wall-associated NlpC family hydrolase